MDLKKIYNYAIQNFISTPTNVYSRSPDPGSSPEVVYNTVILKIKYAILHL